MASPALQPDAPLAPGKPPLAPANDDGASESVTSTATAPDPKTAELEGELDKTKAKISAIDEATGALTPPKLDIPKAPEPKQTDPLEAWGSSAMVLATIGSLLTRTPLTTAMNAAAGAMKAYKQNDLETAQQEFDRWKTSSEMAIKQQDFQMEAYKAALSKANVDEKTALAQFGAYAKAFGDETAYQAMINRGKEGVDKLMLDMQKYNEKMQLDAPKVVESNNFMQAFKDPDFQKKLSTMNPAQRGEAMSDLLTKTAPDLAKGAGVMDNDTKQMIVDWIEAGDIQDARTFITGFGQSSARVRSQIAQALTQDMSKKGMKAGDLAAGAAEFMGLKAGERTLGSTQARIGLGAAEMQTLIPQVEEASKELPRGNYPTMNKMIQAMQAESGNQKVRNLAVRLQGLKSAYSQVLTRGGVPTDAARSATDELFATSDPKIVLDTVLGAVQQETAAIKRAPKIVRDELRQSLLGSPTAMTPSTTKFADANQVKAAFTSGLLTQPEAAKILKDQFGYQD